MEGRKPQFEPGLGRSPGERKGNPLQYSGLENSMDCIAPGVAKSHTGLSNFHFRSPWRETGGYSYPHDCQLERSISSLSQYNMGKAQRPMPML